MSYSYERMDGQRRAASGVRYGASSRRSTLGYWVPLFMTVTAATIGVAAWIWAERGDNDAETSDGSSDEDHNTRPTPPPGYASMTGSLPPGPGPSGFQGPSVPGPMGPGGFEVPPTQPRGPSNQGGPRSTDVETRTAEDAGLMNRVSGAFRWTSNPQQSYDWASKKVVAGVAAAGAMVGGALTTMSEGTQDNYEDHERWKEEATNRDQYTETQRGSNPRGAAEEYYSGGRDSSGPSAMKPRKRNSVAVVVSAAESDSNGAGDLGQYAVSCERAVQST
jgi:hypothetical protein